MADAMRSPRAATRLRLLRALAYWSAGVATYNVLGGQGSEPSIILTLGLASWGAWESRTAEGRATSVTYGALLGLALYAVDVALQTVRALVPGAARPYQVPGWGPTAFLIVLVVTQSTVVTLARERQLAKDAAATRA